MCSLRHLLISVAICYTISIRTSACANITTTPVKYINNKHSNKITAAEETSSSGFFPELSDLLIAPNTRWCGRGNSAGKYNHLGGASQADKCCRKHDHCKLNIPGLQRKWDLFNYRPYTLSHCSCDMRFRMCLKMARSSDAQIVGKIFFNMVQTQCFVIKKEEICQKRMPGTNECIKTVKKRKAYLRTNRKF